MKGGTIVLLLATFAVAFAVDDDTPSDHVPDFDKIDHRLDHLTARLITLEDKIEHRTDPERIKNARSLRYKVAQIEGTGCSKKEFQCGGVDPQCVGLLLVCDGVKDCRNGEDEKHCEVPIKAGDVFEGHMIFDHCTKRQPEGIDFEITSVRQSSFFTSYVKVTGNIIIEKEDDTMDGHVALPSVGIYSQGSHKIVFAAPEPDRLYLVVEFDGSNFDRAVGRIKRDSGDECAKLIFTRKH